MVARRSIKKAMRILPVAAAFALASCGGNTSGGGDSGQGSGFVADENTVGTLELQLVSDELAVADSAGFFVRVVNSSGQAVPNIRVVCDTEAGLALIEPSNGNELTDASGTMSGRYGCVNPGSYQIACRLAAGGNVRRFQGVRCTGDRPGGWDGFPDSGGGGLGGDRGDDGEPIDGNNVRIVSINFSDGEESPTRSIDTIYTADCEPESTSLEGENFTDAYVLIEISNASATTFVFDSYQFSVPNATTSNGTYRSPVIALTGSTFDVDPGSKATFTSTFAYFLNATGTKAFVGSSTDLATLFAAIQGGEPSAVRDVRITVFGSDSEGNEVELNGTVSVRFAGFDRCSSE